MKGRASSLTSVIASGRELEAYVQENGATGIADIGYSRTEERYKTLEVNLIHVHTHMYVIHASTCTCTYSTSPIVDYIYNFAGESI